MATVVFADLVGSTGIFERLGDETAGRFVTQLTSALSRTFEQHSGRVVKLLGDGLFVVFPAERDALAACIAIQNRLQDKPVYPGGSTPAVQMQMDSRVSRVHATVEWRAGHFILGDASSFGTWVYVGNQSEPVVLRRTECHLVGQGQISLGCERDAKSAPVVLFSVKA